MTEDEEDRDDVLIAAACRGVVVRFAHLLDHREFERAARLFAPDGVWERHGERLVGPDRILQVIADRPAETVERHVMTTIDVEVLSATRARACSYVLIVRGPGIPGEAVRVRAPQALGEFIDELVLTSEGWRIAARRAVPVFAFGDPAV